MPYANRPSEGETQVQENSWAAVPWFDISTLPLLQAYLLMLSQDEFTALLQRYAAGQGTADDQHLLGRWLAQPAAAGQPALTEEELTQIRITMWRHIEQATKGS